MASTEFLQISDASSPFNRSDSDVTLLSSDNVRFSCHKNILSIASPFFADMFSLPQVVDQQTNCPSGDPCALPDRIPVIPVTETTEILDILLRLVYPVDVPDLTDITKVVEVIRARRKYQMSGAGLAIASQQLDEFTRTQSLRVFAVACRFGMEEEARTAAHQVRTGTIRGRKKISGITSEQLILKEVPEMTYVTAGSIFRLWWYLRKGGVVGAAFRFTEHSQSDGTTPCPFQLTSSSMCSPTLHCDGDDTVVNEASWLGAYGQFERIPADPRVRSSIDLSVDIPVHQLILSLCSPVLAEEISRSIVKSDDADNEELPVIYLSENAKLLQYLILYCYGAPASIIDSERHTVDADLLVAVVRAANRYSMSKVIDAARLVLQPFLATDPIHAYYVAVACGWRYEAREAARHSIALANAHHVYVSQMENCPAEAYLSLARYHAKCVELVVTTRNRLYAIPKASSHFLATHPRGDSVPPNVLHRDTSFSLSSHLHRTISVNLVHYHFDRIHNYIRSGDECQTSDVNSMEVQSRVIDTEIHSEISKVRVVP